MPKSKTSYTSLLDLLNSLFVFDIKELLINFSFIYYLTVFLILVRILIYFGVSIINLINIKHSSLVKTTNVRSLFNCILKFYETNSLKYTIIKLTTVTCL